MPDLPSQRLSQRLMYQTCEHSGSNRNLEDGVAWFLLEGKTELPGDKPHGAEKRTNNKLDPHCNFESANRTPGHIVERRMLSPLHHACSLKIFLWSRNWSSFIFNDDDYHVDDSDDDDDDDDDEVKFLSE